MRFSRVEEYLSEALTSRHTKLVFNLLLLFLLLLLLLHLSLSPSIKPSELQKRTTSKNQHWK